MVTTRQFDFAFLLVVSNFILNLLLLLIEAIVELPIDPVDPKIAIFFFMGKVLKCIEYWQV